MTSLAGTLRFADRYRVLRRLGAGGMATVYLAEDERLGRRVAVKRLHADSPEDVAKRFDREARLGASLNHPNLVAVYDTVTDAEGVLIVMEYVDGPTLAQALKDGPLPVERALEMVGGVASALDHAHAQGIIHRDVKPANILLGEGGRAKLADLGIAFAAEHATHITRTGTVLGTPSYMAPEQLESREIGPEVDMYALGAVAFEALSGRKARTGATPVEIAHRIANEPAPELREAWPEAPPAAGEALCAAMAADPAQRPCSAGDLVEWLAAALGGREVPTEATRRAGAGAAAVAGGAGAAAAASAGVGTHAAAGEAAAASGAAPEPTHRREAAGPREHAVDDEPPQPAEQQLSGRAEGAHPLQPAESRAPRRRAAWLVPAALIAALGVIAALVVLGDGGAGSGRQETSGGERAERGGDPTSAGGGTGAPAAATRDPATAVKSFYDLAAADDYAGAWALAGPGFRAQLGGFESFRGAMTTLESIGFRRADALSEARDSARVAIDTVATHTDRVDQCRGTLDLTRGAARRWVIEHADVSCSSGGRSGAGAAAGGDAAGATDGASGEASGASSSGSPTSVGGSATVRSGAVEARKPKTKGTRGPAAAGGKAGK